MAGIRPGGGFAPFDGCCSCETEEGINYQTNPILIKPAWKSEGNEPNYGDGRQTQGR
jgi:hypothetical protein